MNTITYLTLVLTYQCSARCAHCCLGAGPEFSEWMEMEDAERHIAGALKTNSIQCVSLVGGEPLLDVERTVAIGKIARNHGIPLVEVNTNACWATSEDEAIRVIRKLTEAGLAIPSISVDAFHQRYVPRERVLCALRAARKLGLDMHGYPQLLDRENANSLDLETRRLMDWLEGEGEKAKASGGGVIFHGRGANLAAQSGKSRGVPRELCMGPIWFGTIDFRNLGGIQIDPNGWVMVEHGVAIGNAKRQPLERTLATFSPDEHPILRVLMRDGPFGLTQIPEAKDFCLREEGYVDKCHLCQEIRAHLRPHFPDILCPSACYPGLD